MATMSASHHQPAAAIEVVNRKLNANNNNVTGNVSNANPGGRNRPDAVNRSVSNSGGKRGRSPSPQNGIARKKLGGNNMAGRGLLTADPSAFKRRILITNISYDADWNELKEFIKSKLPDIPEVFVRIFSSENAKSRGMAIAEFRNEDAVKQAVNILNQQEFKGRNLHVREETAESRDEFGTPLKFDQNNNLIRQDNGAAGGGPANNGMAPRGAGPNALVRTGSTGAIGMPMGMPTGPPMSPKDTFGVSMSLLQDLGIQLPLSRRAYVANLDYKTDEKEIIRVFSLAGKVLEVEFLKSGEGQNKGQCLVEYSHPVEAVQAVSMFRGAYFNGRQLSVRVDSRKMNERQYQIPFPTLTNLPTSITGIGAGLGEHGKPLDYADQLMDILVGYRPAQAVVSMAHDVAAAQQLIVQQQQQQLALQQQQQQLTQQQAQQQAQAAAMSLMNAAGSVGMMSPAIGGGAGILGHPGFAMGGTPQGVPVQQQSGMAMQTPNGMIVMPSGAGVGGASQPQGQMMMNQPQQMVSMMGGASSNMMPQAGGLNMMMQPPSQNGQQQAQQQQQQQLANSMQMQNAMPQQYGSHQYGNDVGGMMSGTGGASAMPNNMQMMANGMPVGNGGMYSQQSGASSQTHASQQQQQQQSDLAAGGGGGWAAAAMPGGFGGDGAVGQMQQQHNMMGGMDMSGAGMMMGQPQMGGMHQQQQQQQHGRPYGNTGYNNNRMGGGGGGGSQDMNLLVSNVPAGVEWQELREHFNRVTGMKGIRAVEKKKDAEGIFVVKYFERDAFMKAQQMMDRTSVKGRLIDVTLAPPGYR